MIFVPPGGRGRWWRALIGFAGVGLPLAACAIEPDPPPSFPPSAFSGMGDVMAKCMQYASQSTCERSTWGSDEP